MGEMSSMMGSVMKATQGPADPGIQPTPSSDFGYKPSAPASAAALGDLGESPIMPQPLGQSGLRLSELLARRR